MGAETMTIDRFNIYKKPLLQGGSLVVGWQSADLGKVGMTIMDDLIEGLACEPVADIDPLDFFPFDGADFRSNLVQVPEARFWASEENNILLFKSDEPSQQHYQFLTSVLDFASEICNINKVYTINAVPSMITHMQSRKILTVYNREGLRDELQEYDDVENMEWEGPPAISSYLLWVARRRGLDGISLWPEIPFYLSALEDPGAIRTTMLFLNQRLFLPFDLELLESRDDELVQKMARLREQNTEINELLDKIENEVALNEQEQMTLTQEVYRFMN